MSKEWAQEPWGMGIRESGTVCTSGGSGFVFYRPGSNGLPFHQSDLDRAIACVNACAPLSDPTTSIPALLRVAEAMKLARKYIEEAATPQGGYGFFCGGDPRDFVPDEESCSPEELAAHKKACEEADAEEKARKLSCPSGWVAPGIHVTRSPFGIGSYTYRDEQAAALLALVDQALSALPASDERAP